MLTHERIVDFMDKTAEGTAVPGGGSISALCAASAASLVCMVANLTLGKKKYENVRAEMEAVRDSADQLKTKFVAAVDADAAAYTQVMQTLSLPRETAMEKEQRQKALQEALKGAALAPLDVAADALLLLSLAEVVVRSGNKNAATDAGVAVLAARAAVQGALYNVKTNLMGIHDDAFNAGLKAKIARIEAETEAEAARLLAAINMEMDMGTIK